MAGEEHLPAQLGLEWAGIEAFVRVRRELLEADARFSEVGDAGLFACMDREGVLTHHVAGVDNIEHAMQYPPAIGRARIRGAVIRRVQQVRQHFLGSWGSISNLVEQTRLDLSHPFETEERWQSGDAPSVRPEPVSEPPAAVPTDDVPPFARRADALDLLLQGDYERAQALLDGLVRAGSRSSEHPVPRRQARDRAVRPGARTGSSSRKRGRCAWAPAPMPSGACCGSGPCSRCSPARNPGPGWAG